MFSDEYRHHNNEAVFAVAPTVFSSYGVAFFFYMIMTQYHKSVWLILWQIVKQNEFSIIFSVV